MKFDERINRNPDETPETQNIQDKVADEAQQQGEELTIIRILELFRKNSEEQAEFAKNPPENVRTRKINRYLAQAQAGSNDRTQTESACDCSIPALTGMNIPEEIPVGVDITVGPESDGQDILNYLNKNLDFRMSDEEKYGNILQGKREEAERQHKLMREKAKAENGFDPYILAKLQRIEQWKKTREKAHSTFHHYQTTGSFYFGRDEIKNECRDIFTVRIALSPKAKKENRKNGTKGEKKPEKHRKASEMRIDKEVLFGRLVYLVKDTMGITCEDLTFVNDFRRWIAELVTCKAVLMTQEHAKSGMKILMGEEYIISIGELRKKINWCFQPNDSMLLDPKEVAELEDPILKKYAHVYQTFFLDELENNCIKYAKLNFDCDYDLYFNDSEITKSPYKSKKLPPIYRHINSKYIYDREIDNES
ncbi:MAG: hypothetical protein LWY06_01355 [Firmicutes bacterium]|nr:hypothetical protein [Bacillota bacterium]